LINTFRQEHGGRSASKIARLRQDLAQKGDSNSASARAQVGKRQREQWKEYYFGSGSSNGIIGIYSDYFSRYPEELTEEEIKKIADSLSKDAEGRLKATLGAANQEWAQAHLNESQTRTHVAIMRRDWESISRKGIGETITCLQLLLKDQRRKAKQKTTEDAGPESKKKHSQMSDTTFVDCPEIIPKSRDYLRKFIVSKNREYLENVQEYKPQEGYGRFKNWDKFVAIIRDISSWFQDIFGPVNIPGNFQSPQQLVNTVQGCLDKLKERDKYFKLYDEQRTDDDRHEIVKISDQMRRETIDAFTFFLEQAQKEHAEGLEFRVGGKAMKVFVSHSSEDKKIAEAFVELLRAALNLQPKEIRCTSVDGYKLEAGADDEEQLRQEIFDSQVFLALLSPMSTKSVFVMFELGARWGARGYLAPIMISGLSTKDLKKPLSSIHAISGISESDLHQLVETISTKLKIDANNPAVYVKALKAFIDSAQ